jgi:hypothetical protein
VGLFGTGWDPNVLVRAVRGLDGTEWNGAARGMDAGWIVRRDGARARTRVRLRRYSRDETRGRSRGQGRAGRVGMSVQRADGDDSHSGERRHRGSRRGQRLMLCALALTAVFALAGCGGEEQTECHDTAFGGVSCTSETRNDAGEWLKKNWLLAGLMGFGLIAVAGAGIDKLKASQPPPPGGAGGVDALQRGPATPTGATAASNVAAGQGRAVLASDIRAGDWLVAPSGEFLIVSTHIDPTNHRVVGVTFDDGSSLVLARSQTVRVR